MHVMIYIYIHICIYIYINYVYYIWHMIYIYIHLNIYVYIYVYAFFNCKLGLQDLARKRKSSNSLTSDLALTPWDLDHGCESKAVFQGRFECESTQITSFAVMRCWLNYRKIQHTGTQLLQFHGLQPTEKKHIESFTPWHM